MSVVSPIMNMAALEAEKSLLGSLLVDRDAIAAIADRITVKAFINPYHQAIFAAMIRCWESRVPTDIVTVHDELARDPMFATEDQWLDSVNLLAELMRYPIEYGWGCHAPYYAERVVGHARRRAMAEAGLAIVDQASKSGDMDLAVVMQKAIANLDQFGAMEEPKGPRSYAEAIPDFQNELLDLLNGTADARGVATGYTFLDKKLHGGLFPGELAILAARPGMGKTAFAVQIAHNAAKRGQRALIFSAEMSMSSLIRRAISDVAGTPFGDAALGRLAPSQYDLFLQASERLAGLPVSIDDTSAISTAQMLVRIQAEQRKHPDLALVIFDYISLAGDKVQGDNEQQRTTKIVRNLKHIARVCDLPVLALGQLNRAVETRVGRRPTLADLRDSGSVEQEADKVLFLFRNDYYVDMGQTEPVPGKEGICEVIIAKHRNGPTGEVELRFLEDRMAFRTIEPDYIQRQVA